MQRHNQARLVAECETSYPPMKTPLQIEKHASSLYTNTIFYDIQTEILEGSFSCKISSKEQATDHVLYTIQEGKKKSITVQYYKENETVRCSCGKFTRVGILCKHAFAVLKDDDAEVIPAKYIIPRWTQNACAHNRANDHIQQGGPDNTEIEEKRLTAKLWSEFYSCIALSQANTSEMQEMLDWILEHKSKLLKTKEKKHDTNNKNELLKTFYGTQATTVVQVKPPQTSTSIKEQREWKAIKEHTGESTSKEKKRWTHMPLL
ncbi:PREDICTED: protein FAR1-RELATED SEQUENCE 1-like [Ipomoea nil]|uniref:protein FAR1-RELATED SEQUENCE 1-like n=1 Tax=Ipomoea nil TaxID=35883 RepID=UPI00090099C4|nr:PREDICTED: protein FAR1-RELATED SEQUENCE 1-like [Ipomoea nil]